MLNVLTNPTEALLEAKKEASVGKAVMELVVASVLFAVAAYLGIGQLFGGLASVPGIGALVAGGSALLAAAVFVGVLVFGLIAGFVATKIFKTLGGNGGFSAGLTPLSYSWFLTSIGVIVAVLLNYLPWVGGMLGALAVLYFVAIGTAVMFRGYKELFDVDMVTVLVGVTLLWGAFALAGNVALLLSLSGFLASLAAPLASLGNTGLMG